jgi:hypothetical protein
LGLGGNSRKLPRSESQPLVRNSIVLRQFCRLYLESAPDDTTLIRWANQIGPETVASLNERAVELACSLKVTRGRKLRVDSMVAETNILTILPTAPCWQTGLLGCSLVFSGERRRRCRPRLLVAWARRRFFALATAVSGGWLSGCTGSLGAKVRRPVRSSKKLTESSSPSPRQAALKQNGSSKRCGNMPMTVVGLGAFSRRSSSTLCL